MAELRNDAACQPAAQPGETVVPVITQADRDGVTLRVADVMTVTPRTCSPFSTALEAALVFRDADCGIIPVTEAGRPIGVFTDRDLALAVADFDGNLANATVGDVMNRDVVTVAPNASLDDALETMVKHALRRLLVIESDGSLVGVLSWTDLVPHVSEHRLGEVVGRLATAR